MPLAWRRCTRPCFALNSEKVEKRVVAALDESQLLVAAVFAHIAAHRNPTRKRGGARGCPRLRVGLRIIRVKRFRRDGAKIGYGPPACGEVCARAFSSTLRDKRGPLFPLLAVREPR